MLNPNSLFFGSPDPDPPALEEKPIWSGGDGMWQDSDHSDDKTDVPVDQLEQSTEQASLNESEEERRSPLGPVSPGAAVATVPSARMPSGPPPGLPLLSVGDDQLRSPTTMKPVLEIGSAGKDSDDDEADDEDSDDENMVGKGLLEPLRYSELPSIGSANHFSGNCDRCCFHPKGRCLNGFNCQHCHFDHEKRKRKNKKKNKSKQLNSLNCDEMEMMSASADGSSMPVSPEAPFIGGMVLPQADFACPNVSTPPQHNGSAGFLPQQPQYFGGSDAASRPPLPASALVENKWYQTATGTPTQSSPPQLPPPLQENFISSPPPCYDFNSQMSGGLGQTLLGPPAENGYQSRLDLEPRYPGDGLDRREEYIRQLESENRYLRTCLIQYLGPNAAALSLLPPPPGGPPQQQFFRPPELSGLMAADDIVNGSAHPLPFGPCPPPPPGVPAPMPPGASLVQGGVLPTMSSASQGLSPSAPPFWPAWQDTGDITDASARFEVPPHQASCLEQVAVPLLQDANGHLVSTSGVVGLNVAGEAC